MFTVAVSVPKTLIRKTGGLHGFKLRLEGKALHVQRAFQVVHLSQDGSKGRLEKAAMNSCSGCPLHSSGAFTHMGHKGALSGAHYTVHPVHWTESFQTQRVWNSICSRRTDNPFPFSIAFCEASMLPSRSEAQPGFRNDAHGLVPQTRASVTLHGERDLVDVTKGRPSVPRCSVPGSDSSSLSAATGVCSAEKQSPLSFPNTRVRMKPPLHEGHASSPDQGALPNHEYPRPAVDGAHPHVVTCTPSGLPRGLRTPAFLSMSRHPGCAPCAPGGKVPSTMRCACAPRPVPVPRAAANRTAHQLKRLLRGTDVVPN